MITHKVIANKKLVFMYLQGTIKPDDITAFIQFLLKDEDYDPSYSTLIDLRDATLQYRAEDVKRVIEYMRTTDGFSGNRKSAYVTSSSNQVVPPMMMGQSTPNFPMEVKVFSSFEYALDWLAVKNLSEEYFDEIRKSFQ
jgi:hypothetical protein